MSDSKWQTRGGAWTVEVVSLSHGQHPGGTGQWFRVRNHHQHVADVRTVEELARIIPLEKLAEVKS